MSSFRVFLSKRKRLLRLVQLVAHWADVFGFDWHKFVGAVRGFPIVVREYSVLKTQNEKNESRWNLNFTMPCLADRSELSGTATGHYFHQDLLVARKIFGRQPIKHADVGSSIGSFVAHVAAFRQIEVFDIRPLTTTVPNITFKQCDLMDLPNDFVAYCDSLSCLHALEHFGLGRYGDPLDINGHLRGFDNLHKMLQPNGILYLSVPIGVERIDFNAHRVFAIKTVLEWAEDHFELLGFSYVDDQGDLHENTVLDASALSNSLGLYYGCGIFEFRKL